MPDRRGGATLIELLVVLALLGVASGIVGLATGSWRDAGAQAETPASALTALRREAIATARPVTTTVIINGTPASATAMPDGAVFADSAFEDNRFTRRAASAP